MSVLCIGSINTGHCRQQPIKPCKLELISKHLKEAVKLIQSTDKKLECMVLVTFSARLSAIKGIAMYIILPALFWIQFDVGRQLELYGSDTERGTVWGFPLPEMRYIEEQQLKESMLLFKHDCIRNFVIDKNWYGTFKRAKCLLNPSKTVL